MAIEKRINKPKSNKKENNPITYVHVDEFLLTRNDLSPEVKAGFKVYMKGRQYQHSFEGFEKALKEYFNRKIK